MHVRCTKFTQEDSWTRLVHARIGAMCAHHGSTADGDCCGIDVRLSAPFVAKELTRCDLLYDAYDSADSATLLGFALVSTRKRSCLYVALIASFSDGVGRAIVGHLARDPAHPHRFLAARATTKSLGFYLRLEFRLFKWVSIESYVGGGSEQFTAKLEAALARRSRPELAAVRQLLRMHHWIDPTQEEWPMLLRRHDPAQATLRRSPRFAQAVDSLRV